VNLRVSRAQVVDLDHNALGSSQRLASGIRLTSQLPASAAGGAGTFALAGPKCSLGKRCVVALAREATGRGIRVAVRRPVLVAGAVLGERGLVGLSHACAGTAGAAGTCRPSGSPGDSAGPSDVRPAVAGGSAREMERGRGREEGDEGGGDGGRIHLDVAVDENLINERVWCLKERKFVENRQKQCDLRFLKERRVNLMG
jgi:hypothetical protein